jgi:hypothetical protein
MALMQDKRLKKRLVSSWVVLSGEVSERLWSWHHGLETQRAPMGAMLRVVMISEIKTSRRRGSARRTGGGGSESCNGKRRRDVCKENDVISKNTAN